MTFELKGIDFTGRILRSHCEEDRSSVAFLLVIYDVDAVTQFDMPLFMILIFHLHSFD